MNCFCLFGDVEMELSSLMTRWQIRIQRFKMSCRIASAYELDKPE